MKGNRELILRWIKYADEDLLTAKSILSGNFIVTRTVCFQCQQSVEKFLKAYLLFLGKEIIKTHDIERLTGIIAEEDNSITEITDSIIHFTTYISTGRYPDELDDIDLNEAKETVEIAENIQQFLKSKMFPEPSL